MGFATSNKQFYKKVRFNKWFVSSTELAQKNEVFH